MSYQAVLDTCSAALFTRTREYPSAVSLALHGFFDPGWACRRYSFLQALSGGTPEPCDSARRLASGNGGGPNRVPLDSGESLPGIDEEMASQDRSAQENHEKLAVGAATVKKYSDDQSSSLAALPPTGDDPGLCAAG
jgi:hypothetical protein